MNVTEGEIMEQVKLVIFDLDGTLFRTETVDIAAINKALTVNGFKSMPVFERIY